MMKKTLPHRTLVLGGANSGKSKFAESLVISTGYPRTYIATARAWDAEMEQKILDHQTQRGPDWVTLDGSVDLLAALIAANNLVLLDAISMWVSNLLIDEQNVEAAVEDVCAALTEHQSPIVIVSDEVGLGGVSDNALARRFGRALGMLNQRLAADADLVVFVAAGVPMVMKGTLP